MKLKDCIENDLGEIEVNDETGKAINHLLNIVCHVNKNFYKIIKLEDLEYNYEIYEENYRLYNTDYIDDFLDVYNDSVCSFSDYKSAIEYCKRKNKKVFIFLPSNKRDIVKKGEEIAKHGNGVVERLRVDNLSKERLIEVFNELKNTFYEIL
jgi:hypothetical protein